MKIQKQNTSQKYMAIDLVRYGRKMGADEMEVSFLEVNESGVDVRMGKIENIFHSDIVILNSRIIKDKKTVYIISKDLSLKKLRQRIKDAVERTSLIRADEFAGLPEFTPSESYIPSLNLYDPAISTIDFQKAIAFCLDTEKIALSDRRIVYSHGASFRASIQIVVLANSNNYLNDYKKTYFSLGIGLQANGTSCQLMDKFSSMKVHLKDLDMPKVVAKNAVERTVRLLSPKKVKTQKVPVVFEPRVTSWLLGSLFSFFSGEIVIQRSGQFYKIGERVGNRNVTIFDDGLLPGKIGTRPFDSEGVPCQRTQVIDKGILRTFLLNTHAAKRLKLRSTGNCSGVGIGPNNFYLQAGNFTYKKIVSSVKKGVILIKPEGRGFISPSGDISQKFFGLWVEKGKTVYPVSGITISCNIGEILNHIVMVGNNLDMKGVISGPSIKVEELKILGNG